MTLKCFHELDCPDLGDIQHQALEHLWQVYDFTDQKSLNTDLWLKIDYKKLLRACPALMRWTTSMKLYINDIALTVVNTHTGVGLHIDELPVVAKINIPLLNYEHTINEWYYVPPSIKSQFKPTVNHFGNEFWHFENIDITKCELIGSIAMSKPIVFNSQIPHRVVVAPGFRVPRIIMPVMFINQPIKYLTI